MKRFSLQSARVALAVAIGAGLSLLPPAFAQEAGGQQSQAGQQAQSAAQRANANQRAVTFLNTLNQGEIQTAKTMQDKAQNAEVKDYAKMVQDDHQKAQDQLKDIAGKANLQLNMDSRMEQQNKTLDSRLQSASGTDADSQYIRAEARDHTRAIRRVRSLQTQVTDQGVKDYLASVLPVLEKHQRQAHTLQASMRGPAAGTPAGKPAKPPSAPPQL